MESETPRHDQREAEILQMIRGALERARPLLGSRKVVLFGSRASGRARARSDFDLGVLGRPMPLTEFYALEDILQDLPTLYRIEWVDFTRADPLFVTRALQEHVVLYE